MCAIKPDIPVIFTTGYVSDGRNTDYEYRLECLPTAQNRWELDKSGD